MLYKCKLSEFGHYTHEINANGWYEAALKFSEAIYWETASKDRKVRKGSNFKIMVKEGFQEKEFVALVSCSPRFAIKEA